MSRLLVEHECVTCRALPPLPVDEVADPDVEYRPVRPRPAPHGGPRSRRCTTHQREHRRAAKTRAHDARTVRIYDLAPGEYGQLYAAQGGRCAIAGCPATGARKRLAVDHDHVTGEVRGLLCGPHNYELLGKYADQLRAALDYLADPPARRLRAATDRNMSA